MKRLSQYLLGAFLLFGFIACQKEISRESGAPGAGSLQDLLGDCSPKVVGGNYVAGTNVTDSNFVDVGIYVSQKGSYTVSSDVQNGYSFRGTGTFADTGLVMVRLKASGKPIAAGTNDFTVTYDSTFCSVAVTVLPAGSSGGTTSGTCSATVNGTYTRGVALNSTNTVSVQHTYAAAGSFTVTTDTVNGISFKKVVTVGAPGAQTIIMDGLGTPILAQGTHLKLNFGTGNAADTCSFDVTVVAPGPPAGANTYFPMTQGSWWTYEDPFIDSTIITVNGTTTLATKLYNRFITTDDGGNGVDTSYYRKDASNNFYQYTDLAELSGGGAITFAAGTPSEMLFLKETLTTGATWNNDFTGTASGIPVVIRIKFTCDNAAATATYNGNSFTNVYKVSAMVQLNVAGTGFQDQGDPITFYYAKGVGVINFNDGTDDYPILHWLVL
jgi:hypothetical protein